MQYSVDRYGNKISRLGMGCMRFPMSMGRVNLLEAEKILLEAVEQGVNYFDTAYIYPGSEAALGEILEKNGLRDRVNITTKLPHYLVRSRDGLEKLFQEELKRLRTDHLDYYLMHMLTDVPAWEKLKQLGIEEWIREKKASGAIRQVGFSYHGNTDNFIRVLNAYDWDIAMVQYNYMDEHSQAGRRGVRAAAEKGIPVVIMEPLRGGKLANPPKEALRVMEQHPVKKSPAAWALGWLWDQEDVACVLSGMRSVEIVRENVSVVQETAVGSYTDADQAMLRQVAAAINEKMQVSCTGCAYCMPCPKGVDIPGAFAALNRRYSEGKITALKEHFMSTALRREDSSARNCVGCGLCERHCPQAIDIRGNLKRVQRELEGPLYRTGRALVKKLKVF